MFARDLLKVSLLAFAATATKVDPVPADGENIKDLYDLDYDVTMETYDFDGGLKLYHITKSSQDEDFVAKRPLIIDNGYGLSIARNFEKL